MISTNKLRGRIVENRTTINELSQKLGMTPYTLGKKIAGKSPMTLKEASELQRELQIPAEEIPAYFFAR